MHFLLLLLLFSNTFAFRISSWFISEHPATLHKVNWDIYSHMRFSEPIVYPNGTAVCNTSDTFFASFVKKAHAHNVKVIWGPGNQNFSDILWNNPPQREMYLQSIGNAANKCNVDGIEIDYEWQDITKKTYGIVPPRLSTIYTQYLSELKKSLGPHKIVSADVSLWGIAPGNYILGVLPWVNVSMLNAGAFDFINTMSYHWVAGGEIWPWIKDAILIDLWGIDRKRVNIGIPYYSQQRKGGNIFKEPTWGYLSTFCPNIDPDINICHNVTFVGKRMNQRIGDFLRREKFGGTFPWAATYDSFTNNNTLVTWLHGGF